MDALQEIEIFKSSKLHKNQLLNNQLPSRSNILYDAALQRTSRMQNPTHIIRELSEH